MSQERIDDFMSMAKYYARAEKELGTQPWVYIGIERIDAQTCKTTRLFAYDLPRELYERKRWVIRWRVARLQCKYPRDTITTYHSYYDKRLGNDAGMNGCLRRLVSLKAKCIALQRNIDAYVIWHRANDLFFDEATDANLIKAREKLSAKQAQVQAAEERLKIKIEQLRPHETPPIH